VIVTRAVVKNHRYLRDQGLPHSKSVASVLLPRGTPRGAEHFIGGLLASAMAAASLASTGFRRRTRAA